MYERLAGAVYQSNDDERAMGDGLTERESLVCVGRGSCIETRALLLLGIESTQNR